MPFHCGWLIVEKLLKEFVYRIEINYFVFVIIFSGALLIAFLTIGIKAYRATGINPSVDLKIK